MTDTGTLNFNWSQALVAGFIAAGVSDAVISPGARSTPLALAMLRQPRLRCHVAIDERSAAFFALGIAKASRRPALVLATSGTAPANWLPTVIEASQSGVPLLLISADRPPELQGCGANQSIDQIGLFGSHVRASHALGTPHDGFDPAYLHRFAARAYEQAIWPEPGPVHINQPFREPLLPLADTTEAEIPESIRVVHPALQPAREAIGDFASRISGRPGIIVCGEMPACPENTNAIAALAERLDVPILAEPLAGLRYGDHDRSHLCVRYNQWLVDQRFVEMHQPEWVLRFGTFPISRNLQNYVGGIRTTHAVVEPWPRWSDPAHLLTHLFRAEPADVCAALLAESLVAAPGGWRQDFAGQEASAAERAEAGHIAAMLEEIPDSTPLFIGNSLAIRQLDSLSGSGEKFIHFYGNRGASGIDGNISTAMGIAAVHGSVVALLGDLTTQHDLGGLALAQGRNAVIVVVNNAGGGIFDHLPQRQLPEFERGWRTPQQISFEHAALTFSLGFGRAESIDAFRKALRVALAAGGPHLIELQMP
ncbi:MAG: 2-succinyl-5-enolpyruvyl-6-hydroxy-3-cyclohexene-1-carboxylic-acid synthase [Gammaproteobacteria bacterium]|nr:2-succinyl-5-enolpyruvyl-6-hydroxy-3-cyclohexene-1-carboxylic-acid synthase [Gammaproteobacteria bacterium]MBU2435652.1 2-succinyl-5-enolpyruvyl-6-hydroxy-3-cyclohexene-1-carboxylic-acid synthase [Gammaproteobacteria bacterium]MBU2449567.1 2-succinyl-5-enolpyruvyl-6-hydroxy-3-cyclohexene-1-carboxylic-acid synthase [Gammaproteobacteria bacterium]